MREQKMWEEESNPNILMIQSLRQEASSMLIINNAIVEQLWEIEQKLQRPIPDEETKKALLEQKTVLSKKIQSDNYVEKIRNLKEKIYTLEINEFGESDILDNSPGNTNSLI